MIIILTYLKILTMKKHLLIIALLSFCFSVVFSQESKNDKSKDGKSKEDETKTGWNFGAIPVVAYDTDIGFKYGGLVNFYHYGDGSIYPKYNHSIYLEWSRTTKGSGINQFRYDSEHLIPGIRVNAEVSLLTEKALDFYGFNGYESSYNPNFADTDHLDYISRMYYRHDRNLLRIKTEFQGKIIGNKLRWLTGLVHYNNKISTVDIDNLNEGKEAIDLLPDTALLYDKYVEWGIIPQNQADGGINNFIKFGIVWDTRDNEPNPQSGLWDEILFMSAPGILGNKDYAFTKIILTHRQYFTLIEKKLSFAYRLSYQGKLFGDMPFYSLPFVYDSQITRDGLGGAKTMRGVLRNRIVGESVGYSTMELRWIFLRTKLFKQNFYIALSGFMDNGIVLKNFDFDTSDIPVGIDIVDGKENLHAGFGSGLHFALNQNFVIAIDYGFAADKRDGKNGLYIGMNWLF